MPRLQLQPSIRTDSRSRAALRLVERLEAPSQHGDVVGTGRMDLSPLLVYWLATTPASALPYLLWQFDLLSPFWSLLTGTDSEDTPGVRELISRAIPLHARRGTPGVIAEILAQLGWRGSMQEGQDSWGGSLRDDGTPYPEDEGWALCRILLEATEFVRPQARDITWRADRYYYVGDVVAFPTLAGGLYMATLAPPLAVPPYYESVAAVHRFRYLSEVSTLRTIHWAELPTFNGVPYRVMTQSDADLVRAAFVFFRREACWLDRVICQLPPILDVLFPAVSDSIGAGPVDRAVEVGFASDAVATVDNVGVRDAIARVPDHGGSWRHHGSNYPNMPTWAGLTYRGVGVGIVDGAPTRRT